jgi:DNA-binding response OmpR family regulator
MTEGRLLVVEDDEQIQRLLDSQLSARGYQVAVVDNGEGALESAVQNPPDVVLLDITLPGLNGLEVCRRLREHSQVPIVLVSAADTPQTKVTALELGADDYLTKPFDISELVARIRAVRRRSTATAPAATGVVDLGALKIDLQRREVSRRGEPVHLTKIEFDLLRELVTNPDKVLTYQHLLSEVWGEGYDDIRPVHVHICNLRRKIEGGPTGPRYILAVPGIGYRLRRDR